MVPNPPEYAHEGDDLGGAQRMAVMAVTHLWSRRSFAGGAAQCRRQRVTRASQPLHGLRNVANTTDQRRIAEALLRPGRTARAGRNRRRHGIRARWPPSVAVIAVTGAVKTGTGDVTAATRGRDPCTGRDRHLAAVTAVAGGLPRSPRADGPGRFRVCSTR